MWLDKLKENGYVVIPKVMSQDEVEKGRDLFWTWLTRLGSGINRNDSNTWSDDNWPGNVYLGFISNHGISQSEFAWYLRSRPKVREIFTKIWDIDRDDDCNMISSMDSVICWRPWWQCDFEDWQPGSEGLHVDQNPRQKPGFHCVQGMLVLHDVSPEVGGLQVVPRSHGDDIQAKLGQYYGIMAGDWCPIPPDSDLHKWAKTKAQLVEAKAGDLIVWDSRLIHGGLVGEGGNGPSASMLSRLAVPVCMMPRNKADKYILHYRKQAVKKGVTFSHWPNEVKMTVASDTHGQNIPNDSQPQLYCLNPVEKQLV